MAWLSISVWTDMTEPDQQTEILAGTGAFVATTANRPGVRECGTGSGSLTIGTLTHGASRVVMDTLRPSAMLFLWFTLGTRDLGSPRVLRQVCVNLTWCLSALWRDTAAHDASTVRRACEVVKSHKRFWTRAELTVVAVSVGDGAGISQFVDESVELQCKWVAVLSMLSGPELKTRKA